MCFRLRRRCLQGQFLQLDLRLRRRCLQGQLFQFDLRLRFLYLCLQLSLRFFPFRLHRQRFQGQFLQFDLRLRFLLCLRLPLGFFRFWPNRLFQNQFLQPDLRLRFLYLCLRYLFFLRRRLRLRKSQRRDLYRRIRLQQLIQICRQLCLQINGAEFICIISRHPLLLKIILVNIRRSRIAQHAVILSLLGSRQRFKLHLQFHGFCNVFAFTEPEYQFIAFPDAFFCHACLGIALCQFVGPFFLILMRLVFAENLDLVLNLGASLPVYLIFQDIPALIVRRQLDKLPI